MSNLFSGDACYMLTAFVGQIGVPADRDWFETQVHRFIHQKEIEGSPRLVGMMDGYKAGIKLHVQTNEEYLHVTVDQGESEPVNFLLRRVGDSVELASAFG